MGITAANDLQCQFRKADKSPASLAPPLAVSENTWRSITKGLSDTVEKVSCGVPILETSAEDNIRDPQPAIG